MPWNLPQLMQTATGYWPAATLSAAVELELFDALEQAGEPVAVAPLAASLRCSAPHLESLLDAMTSLGMLIKRDSRYVLEPTLAPFLTRASATCMIDALRFNADLYPLWGRLADSVRKGQPVVPPQAHLGADPQRTRGFVLGMHSRALALAPAVVGRIDLAGRRRLLDLAGGPGTFSRMLADRCPELRVTHFDLPAVSAIARELLAPDPAVGRFDFVAGDYRADALPTGCDAVLYCGALHQESPDSALRLLAKIHAALEPGGDLWLVDMMLNEDRTAPAFSALFSITMMLTSPQGRVHTETQALHLLQSTGFDQVQCLKPDASPYWIVRGRKPIAPLAPR